VTVTVPADLPAGTAELTLTSPASGTVVHVPFEVEASVPLVETTTRLTAILPIHINRLVPSTLVATVRQGDGARPDGSVVFREGDTVVATVKVRYGVATFTRPPHGGHAQLHSDLRTRRLLCGCGLDERPDARAGLVLIVAVVVALSRLAG
jgi:hypothetical protein